MKALKDIPADKLFPSMKVLDKVNTERKCHVLLVRPEVDSQRSIVVLEYENNSIIAIYHDQMDKYFFAE